MEPVVLQLPGSAVGAPTVTAESDRDQSANMPPAATSTFLTHDTTTRSLNASSSAELQHANTANACSFTRLNVRHQPETLNGKKKLNTYRFMSL